MKKFISMLLAAVMLLAITATAAAADGKITIGNAEVGETYSIYRLLDLESYNAETNAYSYKANAVWEAWLRTQTNFVEFDEHGYVTWKGAKDDDAGGDYTPAAFAKAAKAYADANDIAALDAKEATSATVEFTGLELGYYLVDTTMGTLCSLNTTDPAATVQEKNEKPVIKKEVEEDSDKEFGATDDADMTQTVNFKTIVTAKEGAEDYIIHDILSAGLDLNADSIAVEGATKGTDYTVVFDVACKDKEDKDAVCDFHIVFAQEYLDTLKDNVDIVVTYSATLNDKAVVGGDGNPNDTRLQYNTDNWTDWMTTITYTWDLSVLKYGNGDKTNKLEGAKFVLLNEDKTKVATFAPDGKFTGWAETPAADEAWPAGAELTTDADGKIDVEGLDADTYYLRETKAPDGYNKLFDDADIEITTTKSTDGNTLTYETVVKEINNNSGTVFPETGAKGTVMFVTFGSAAVLIAVIFLVTRKKMSIYED